MKRIIFCLSMVSFFAVLSLLCIVHLKNCTESLSVQLNNISYFLEKDDKESALALAQTAKTEWDKATKIAFFYLEQDRIIKVSSSISKIISLITSDNDEVFAECSDLDTYLDLIYETQIPHLRNIF